MPSITKSDSYRGYAAVRGLDMYYEIHGTGEPLVLLHGGATTIDHCFERLIPVLAASRQVIAVEQQAHGRTADIERDLTFENMADDTASLLRYLDIEQADLFGYSDGGNVALGLATRHPDRVGRMAIAGTSYNIEGMHPVFREMRVNMSAESMPDELREIYQDVAPRPEDWSVLVEKVRKLGSEFPGWKREEIQSIDAPTLVISADSDIVRLEHSVELFNLLPNGNLAILPMTGHDMRLDRPGWILSMLREFFTDHD